MKRVLLVAYWVPPRKGVGALRAAHLVRHLPEFGWEPTVLTAAFSGGESADLAQHYVTTRYWDVKDGFKHLFGISGKGAHEAFNVPIPAYGRKRTPLQFAIASAARVVTYPDEHAGWLPFARSAIKRLASSGEFDAVLSTTPPMSANLAVSLARISIPWVADLRDLWADDDTRERGALQTRLDDRLERASLRHARALTATSERSAERLRARYPNKPCIAVDTGFEQEEWAEIPFGVQPQCTLVYAGILYRGKRDPSVLFEALRDILSEGLARAQDLRVEFYCGRDDWLLRLIEAYGLGEIVHVRGFVDRSAVLAAERRADRLLVLSWDGPATDGVVPGKIFEYFGARRRILAIGGAPHTTVADLLARTGAGVRANGTPEVKREILAALREHAYGPQVVPEEAAADFTAANCAARFAHLLDSVSEERCAPPRERDDGNTLPRSPARTPRTRQSTASWDSGIGPAP